MQWEPAAGGSSPISHTSLNSPPMTPERPTQGRTAPMYEDTPSSARHVGLGLPPSTLLSLHSGSSLSHLASPSSPRSAPHTPPSPVHRPIPLPPVTPYDTPSQTTASSPLFQAVHSPREVSPLRWGPAAAAPGAPEQRGSSLLHLAEPVTGESPRSRSRSEPAHPRTESSVSLEDPPESALSDEEDASPSQPPPAYTRHASGGDLPLPPFSPYPTALVPLPVPSYPATYRPLDPPPECFSTPGPWRLKSRAFAPFRVRSVGRSLAGGWEGMYAPPLEGSGIARADWARFLGDITHTARLAREGISALSPKRVLHPHSGFRTLLSGPSAVEGGPYDQAFRRSETEEVAALVGVWNGSAFERRKVRVTLLPIADGTGERRARWELFVEAL